MMSRRYLFGAFLLILFCACSDDYDSGESVGSSSDQGMMVSDASNVSCSADTDCPNGQVCEDGVCELGCGANAQCPQGYECQNGRVCLSVTLCETNADCGNGVCDCEGICRGQPSEPCSTDLQCDVQDFCNTCTGECQSRSGQCEPCESDSECASNAKCRQPNGSLVASIQGVEGAGVCLRECQGSCDILGPGYACAPGSGGQQLCMPQSGSCGSLLGCANDTDCDPTEFCNERRRCQPGCADDTECPNGTLCQGVRCLPPCNTGTNPCNEGLICDEAGRCRVENGCASSADCLMPETYCDRSTYLCVSGCEVDNDCQDANQQCVAGSCRERGCSGNYQCAFGQVCDLASGQCVDAGGRHCESGCNPQTEGSCGERAICVSLQDDDGNALGDFCFEACLEEPNECPQGYQCVEFEQQGMGMMSGGPSGFYCVRDCTYNPTSN